MARPKKNKVTKAQLGVIVVLASLIILSLAMFVIDSLFQRVLNMDFWKTLLIISLPSLISYLVGGNMSSRPP